MKGDGGKVEKLCRDMFVQAVSTLLRNGLGNALVVIAGTASKSKVNHVKKIYTKKTKIY